MRKHIEHLFNALLICHNNVISSDCVYISGNFDIYDCVVIYIQLKWLLIDSHNFMSLSHIKIEWRLRIQLTVWVAEGISTRGMQQKTAFSLSLSLSFSLLKRPKMFKRHNRGRAGYSKVSNRLLVTLISGILFNAKLRHGASRL